MIKVDKLSFSYSDKAVLNEIDICANNGDLLAVLGPNGVGKTTLINILTGKLEVQRGDVEFDGISIKNDFPNEIKKKIGVMREIEGLYTKMTGYEYLRFIAVLYGYPVDKIDARIIELSKKYNIENEIDRQIKKYSSGTKKKIEFCAAIIHQAKILFLDEPFESVDPVVCYEIKEFLKEYAESQNAIIVITSHILETIEHLCSKYVIINNGYVVDSGEMVEDLENKYLQVVGYIDEEDDEKNDEE